MFLQLTALAHERCEPVHCGVEEFGPWGLRLRPNARVRSSLQIQNQLLWDVTYSVDRHSRRVTLGSKGKKFLALFGCSWVFGTGVADQETLPSQLAKLLPDFKIYNYGFPGSGPNWALARVQDPEFSREIPEDSGTFLYVLMDSQIARANGFLVERTFSGKAPLFIRENGNFRNIGSLDEARPLRTFLYRTVTDMARAFGFFNRFNWPRRPSIEHYQYGCELLAGIKTRLAALRPNSRFIVLNHPMLRVADKGFLRCLEEQKVSVVESILQIKSEYLVPIDRHPTALLHRDLAKELSKSL